MAKIAVENIVKIFNKHSRNANKVLDNVSFELPEKGLVCIFGKSGSGKTTLLNIIGGLDTADEGKVYIDGECTKGRADKLRNEKIGFIFQNYYLEKGYTISEILRNQMLIAGFKDEAEIERRTAEALKLVDMERFKNKLGDALSGGQQQRVAIARAIVKGSDVILADEPTGNLDAENTMKVMDILKEISKTQLVVIVTHEVSLIKKYADSHIKLVDGKLAKDGIIEETDLAPATYDNVSTIHTSCDCLKTFQKSTAKHNGRLFNFRKIFKSNNDGEKAYSTGNIFKQIFILTLAVVVSFFSFSLFETIRAASDNRPLGENTVYTSLNAYSVLRKTDESLYTSIDFFDTEKHSGSFSYGSIAALSGIKVNYAPKAIENGDDLKLDYGRMPNVGEALVSRSMAQALKSQLSLSELSSDKAITLMTFDEQFKITGIVEGDENIVYLNKIDYVNFLGVYNKIGFSDNGEIFFKDTFGQSSFTAEILICEDDIDDDKIQVEINRNSLYKMLADTKQADYEIEKTNSILKKTPYAIQVTGSKVYVERFEITRDTMDTDVRLYVSENTLNNIFVYISPNLDAATFQNSDCYFEITAENAEKLAVLKQDLKDLGVTAVNVSAAYEQKNEEAREEASKNLTLFVTVILLLLTIYFFIEKSASIKNSKEYGIYRAIGVNRSNLLYKECVLALANNILTYFAFTLITVTLLAVRYSIMNVAFEGFLLVSLANFILSAVVMVVISLIPYLFVLTKTPSEILASYDI